MTRLPIGCRHNLDVYLAQYRYSLAVVIQALAIERWKESALKILGGTARLAVIPHGREGLSTSSPVALKTPLSRQSQDKMSIDNQQDLILVTCARYLYRSPFTKSSCTYDYTAASKAPTSSHDLQRHGLDFVLPVTATSPLSI